jgi:hypothetical protein
MDFFVTPDRICPQTPSTPIKAYRLAAASCSGEPTPAFDRIGERVVFGMSGWAPGSGCLSLMPIP